MNFTEKKGRFNLRLKFAILLRIQLLNYRARIIIINSGNAPRSPCVAEPSPVLTGGVLDFYDPARSYLASKQ
jgi:hypothetical protein